MSREPNWDRTPWNAGPGELPGDDELPAVTKITCDICGKVIKDGDSTAAYYELTGHYYCIEDYAIHNEGPEYEPE